MEMTTARTAEEAGRAGTSTSGQGDNAFAPPAGATPGQRTGSQATDGQASEPVWGEPEDRAPKPPDETTLAMNIIEDAITAAETAMSEACRTGMTQLRAAATDAGRVIVERAPARSVARGPDGPRPEAMALIDATAGAGAQAATDQYPFTPETEQRRAVAVGTAGRDNAGAQGTVLHQAPPEFRYNSSSQQEGDSNGYGGGWGDNRVGDTIIAGEDEAPYSKVRVAQVGKDTNVMGPEETIGYLKARDCGHAAHTTNRRSYSGSR